MFIFPVTHTGSCAFRGPRGNATHPLVQQRQQDPDVVRVGPDPGVDGVAQVEEEVEVLHRGNGVEHHLWTHHPIHG